MAVASPAETFAKTHSPKKFKKKAKRSGYSGKLAYLCGADMEWWATKHGVTEFTDEYNWSTGLNW